MPKFVNKELVIKKEKARNNRISGSLKRMVKDRERIGTIHLCTDLVTLGPDSKF